MKQMKTNKKYENGMSIVQLEERFEMVATGKRGYQDPDDPFSDIGLTC